MGAASVLASVLDELDRDGVPDDARDVFELDEEVGALVELAEPPSVWPSDVGAVGVEFAGDEAVGDDSAGDDVAGMMLTGGVQPRMGPQAGPIQAAGKLSTVRDSPFSS